MVRAIGRAIVRLGRWIARHHWTWGAGPPLVILVAPYLVANVTTGRRLAHEIALIRASGAPVTMEELAPPPVPDARNAALLYLRAFKFLPSEKDKQKLGDFLSPDEKRPVRVSIEEVRRIVAHSTPAFPLLERAAARPACRFPVKWEGGGFARFPHVRDMRHSAQLLAARAILRAQRGELERPAGDI